MPPANRENPAERDQEIVRNVQSALASRHVPSLRRLRVSSKGGDVTVHGNVRSFYEKQLVHHCCQEVAGVCGLNNAVDVATTSFGSPAYA